VRARADMYRLVAQFAAEGNGVLVISSDDDELVGLCDRIAVMHNGTVQRLLEGAECTVEAVKFYSMTSA
jgi:ribose transport system ATP-binding protein